MDVVTGAMGSLLPKLGELLVGEYKLQKGVKKDIGFLQREMESMHAALSMVAEVPWDQLPKQVKIWAGQIRELSYDMEDVVDNFLVRVEDSDPVANSHKIKQLMQKMADLFPNAKTRHEIANAIKDIMDKVQEVPARRDRYKVDDVIANAARKYKVGLDPRLSVLYEVQKKLVGIEDARDELTKRLTDGDGDVSKQQLKIVSIFGPGGLGKTTLAKAVYDRLQEQYEHKAFVPVGRNPEEKKVLKDILVELRVNASDVATLDERQLIDKLRELLENVRYFIVIDDIWDLNAWKIIKYALLDNKRGSRVITTTRIREVATNTGDVYELEPLSDDLSEELFYTRLFGGKDKCPYDIPSKVSKKILHKCGGVPLAIITIASLLVGKPMGDWSKVYNSIGFGHGDNTDVGNMRHILLFSYYDLPCYLRPCLLHLSMYPEDSFIKKDPLIWKWIAEGFVSEKTEVELFESEQPEVSLFETGERYFNELINRSMIISVDHNIIRGLDACCVHDMVLDMICRLSKEQNFVTTLDSNEKNSSLECNTRRLAVHTRYEEQHNPLVANTNMLKLRSYYVSRCNVSMMPPLSSFQVLRVLEMKDCMDMRDCLKHLGRLHQLRYLSLENTHFRYKSIENSTYITELPKGIGDLKFLQTLNLRNSTIEKLPQSVGLLRKMKHLLADGYCTISAPNWIGNLTSLEELSLNITGEFSTFVEELGKLTELRVLFCHFGGPLNERSKKTLVDSSCNLQKIQILQLEGLDGWSELEADTYWKGYKPPRQLRDLVLSSGFIRLPEWINCSLLPNLSNLKVSAYSWEEQDVVNFGRFPELLKLECLGIPMWNKKRKQLPIPAGMEFPDGAFPKLTSYILIDAPFRFLQGSMQSLKCIVFGTTGLFNDAVIDFDFICTLRNLPSLRMVVAYMDCDGARASDVEEMEAAVRRAIDTHPNRPILNLSRLSQYWMIKESASPLHHTTTVGTSSQVIVEDEEEESDSQQTEQEWHDADDNSVREEQRNQDQSHDDEASESKQTDQQPADEREEAEYESAGAAATESPRTVDVASLAESGEAAAAGTPAPMPARRTWRRWAFFSCLNSGSSSSD